MTNQSSKGIAVWILGGLLAMALNHSALADPPIVSGPPPMTTSWTQAEDTRIGNALGMGIVSSFAPELTQLIPESSSFTVWVKSVAYFAGGRTQLFVDALWMDCETKRMMNLWSLNQPKPTNVWMPANDRFHEILRLNVCPEVARLKREREQRAREDELRREIQRLIQEAEELRKKQEPKGIRM